MIKNYIEAKKIAEKNTGIKFTQCCETNNGWYFITHIEPTGGATFVSRSGKVDSMPSEKFIDDSKNVKKTYKI